MRISNMMCIGLAWAVVCAGEFSMEEKRSLRIDCEKCAKECPGIFADAFCKRCQRYCNNDDATNDNDDEIY